MGYTEYFATHFHKSGSINRKAECDAYFLESLNRGHYRVVKSSMKGSIYYGAVTPLKRPIKGSDGKVNPKGYATRAEVAVMCARLLDLMK